MGEMKTLENAALLADYVNTGSEWAFRELISIYVDPVYSTALRIVGNDRLLAEDVTQTVFIDLARKAPQLQNEVILGGWLHRHTRFVASKTVRSERRRQNRERESVYMNSLQQESPSLEIVGAFLDEAIDDLKAEDKAAILLRFFERRDFRSIGEVLKTSEDAARMRVNRALDRLETCLRRRGVALPATTLGILLAANMVTAAPVGLAASISATALASVAAPAIPGLVRRALIHATAPKLAIVALLLSLGLAPLFFDSLAKSAKNGASPDQQVTQAETAEVKESPPIGDDSQPVSRPIPVQVARIDFLVLEAGSGAPLAGTRIRAVYFREGGQSEIAELMTDPQGQAHIEAPTAPYTGANVFVTAEDHVPKVVSLDRSSTSANHTVELEAGSLIGGVVLDEAQRPVVGVKIEFNGPGINPMQRENVAFGPDTVRQTDASGRWLCTMIPKSYEGIELILSHPEYARCRFAQAANTQAATQSVIVLKRGVTLYGTVQDSAGKLVAGAVVREVHNRREPKLSATCDAEGEFRLDHVARGELSLTVQARGFAPAFVSTEITGSTSRLEVILDQAHVIRGRVVDESGNPIPNALAKTDADAHGECRFEWSARTDHDGCFEWDSAPAEPLLYWFEADGFRRLRRQQLGADSVRQEITLFRNQPVAASSVGLPATGGSNPVANSEAQPPMGFQLAGLVVLPDGQLAPGATVFLDEPGGLLKVGRFNTLPRLEQAVSTQTDATGRFAINATTGAYGILVTHERGYAYVRMADFNEFGRVTLRAWGRVEGRLLLGTNAGANQRILLSNSGGTGRASPSLWLEATTDDEGNFVFDRVPGGGMEVAHLVLSKPNEQHHATCHSREVHIDVADGAVTQVTLGGSGGTVTGHAVVASSGTNVTDWRNATVSLTLKLVEAPEIPPREEYYASTGAFIEALMRFRGTHPDSLSEGSRAIELRRRRYVTLCDRNGAFRMPSVLGGTYELRIVLAEARATSVSPSGRQAKGAEVGSLVREVVVPEGIASQSEVSLDLGVLELAARP